MGTKNSKKKEKKRGVESPKSQNIVVKGDEGKLTMSRLKMKLHKPLGVRKKAEAKFHLPEQDRSWTTTLNEQVIASGQVATAAIIGRANGEVWAASKGFFGESREGQIFLRGDNDSGTTSSLFELANLDSELQFTDLKKLDVEMPFPFFMHGCESNDAKEGDTAGKKLKDYHEKLEMHSSSEYEENYAGKRRVHSRWEQVYFKKFKRIHIGKDIYYRTKLHVALVPDDEEDEHAECETTLALQVRFSGRKVGGGVSIYTTARSIVICTWDTTHDPSHNHTDCENLAEGFSQFVIVSEVEEFEQHKKKLEILTIEDLRDPEFTMSKLRAITIDDLKEKVASKREKEQLASKKTGHKKGKAKLTVAEATQVAKETQKVRDGKLHELFTEVTDMKPFYIKNKENKYAYEVVTEKLDYRKLLMFRESKKRASKFECHNENHIIDITRNGHWVGLGKDRRLFSQNVYDGENDKDKFKWTFDHNEIRNVKHGTELYKMEYI